MGTPPEIRSPQLGRSDTATNGSSSDRSLEDGRPLSSKDHISSNNPVDSEVVQVRPGINNGTSRRRKVPSSVTPNACTTCKKARAKVRKPSIFIRRAHANRPGFLLSAMVPHRAAHGALAEMLPAIADMKFTQRRSKNT